MIVPVVSSKYIDAVKAVSIRLLALHVCERGWTELCSHAGSPNATEQRVEYMSMSPELPVGVITVVHVATIGD